MTLRQKSWVSLFAFIGSVAVVGYVLPARLMWAAFVWFVVAGALWQAFLSTQVVCPKCGGPLNPRRSRLLGGVAFMGGAPARCPDCAADLRGL